MASDACLTIYLDRLPVMHGCDARSAARSGEEYELLFTAPTPIDADDFAPAFYYIGFFAVLGTLSYSVVVRNVETATKAEAIA